MSGIYRENYPSVVDKGANYAVLPADGGKVFVATAAANFTLPAVAEVWNGWNVMICNGAASTLTITAPSGKLVTFNNAAATSIYWSTLNQQVGNGATIVYDGTLAKYVALPYGAGTMTVA
jgi:hypothetical protein